MGLVGDERGQAVQIGAVLLFAVLIIAFSTYQAFVVPDQNREVEFEHNQDVQAQIQELRNAIVSVPVTNSVRAVSVQLGTRYPSRAVAINPGPASGSLRTDGTTDKSQTLTISNTRAPGETGDFWNETRSYNTGTLAYQPNYNLYGEAPTTYYEHTVAFNQFRNDPLTLSGQTMVDGRQITLIALNGSVSRSSSGSTTVDVDPVSPGDGSLRTVTVTNGPGERVSVSFLSRLSENTWEERLLTEEMADNGGYVTDVSSTAGPDPYQTITLTFEQGVEYELRLAKAGVGTRVTPEEATYLTNVTPNGTTVTEGQTTEIVVEARDSYNNPVSAVTVNASGDGGVGPAATTGTDGRARFTFTAPAVESETTYYVKTSLKDPDSNQYKARGQRNVTVRVVVQPENSGGGVDYAVEWRNPSTYPGPTSPVESCSQVPCDPLPMRAVTTPSSAGQLVTFYSNKTAVASMSESVGVTDSDGKADTGLVTGDNGTANIYASNTSKADELWVETYLNSGFETSDIGPWETFGSFEDDQTGRDTEFSNRGSYGYRIDGGNPGGIRNANGFDTTDGKLVVVEYWVREDGPEFDEGPGAPGTDGQGEDLVVQYLTDGGDPTVDADWQTISTLEAGTGGDGDGIQTYEQRARLTAADALHDDFRLRFRQVSADADSDEWHVDDVHLSVVSNVSLGSGGGGGNQAPTASFTASPDPASTGQSITLDASGSTDSDGSITSYEWDTDDDGAYDDLTGESTSTSYSSTGDKTISLRVTDNDGATATASQTVTVESGGTTGFNSASVSGLSDSDDSATQTYTFTIGDSLSSEETFTIELVNSGNGQPEISYSSATASTSPGDATVTSTPELVYTAPSGGLSSDTQVSITVSGIDPGAKSEGTYTVTFTRDSTGDSTTAEFTVTDDTSPGRGP